MVGRPGNFDFDRVVLVADMHVEDRWDQPIHAQRDLEMTDPETFDALAQAITQLGIPLLHYETPAELAQHASAHLNDIVLTIYGGQRSRNRMALVPAICEAFGLRYVGPDVYGRVVAQDKEIAKRLALDSGLRTPPWRVVRQAADTHLALRLEPPLVVKPLMEGSSIGISGRNLVHTTAEVTELAEELLVAFQQPVLVERFVPGREVSYTRIAAEKDSWAFSEIAMSDDPNYFEARLFDADEKTVRKAERHVRNIDAELSSGDRVMLDGLLEAFGRYGYCRIDGRLAQGEFHFLELTPDAWIAPAGQFAMSFTEKGWTYVQVIAAVLLSAGPTPRDRATSG